MREINAHTPLGMNHEIRYRDVFNVVPLHHHVKMCDVQRTIRADWESYIGNPNYLPHGER